MKRKEEFDKDEDGSNKSGKTNTPGRASSRRSRGTADTNTTAIATGAKTNQGVCFAHTLDDLKNCDYIADNKTWRYDAQKKKNGAGWKYYPRHCWDCGGIL